MAQPSIWFTGSDMTLQMRAVRTSTMGSTEYLNDSTGMTADVWSGLSTSSTENQILTNLNLPYVAGSTGRYQNAVQSTGHGMTPGTVGFAHFKLRHQSLNRDWRVIFRVDHPYT